MPTKNPRLSVVLSPSLAATLAAISDETGESASGLVRGFLEQSEPGLVRMLDLVRAAKSAKGQISEGLRGNMSRVVDDLQDALALADARTGRVVADLVATAEQVKGRRRRAADVGAAGARRAAVAAPTPGPVTRGSGRARKGQGKGRRAGRGRAL
jgi:urease gamma subunit